MARRKPAQYDWSRLLFDETLLKKHFTAQSDGHKDFVVLHHSTIVGNGSGSALDAMYRVWQSRPASAHYGVDGELVRQYVWDKDYAWSTGSTAGNRDGISIEHMNSSGAPTWGVAYSTWKTGAKLVAALHVAKKWGRPRDSTVRPHSSFVSTACPGPFIKSIRGQYLTESQHQYDVLLAGGKPPVVKPEPEPQEPIESATYAVKSGDTLWSIARRTDTTVDQLMAWNGIKDVTALEVGTVLVLTKPATPSSPSTHTVKKGDTAWSITRKYGLTLEQLVEWNRLGDPSVLVVGQVLRLSKPTTPVTPPITPPAPKSYDVPLFYVNAAGYNGVTAKGVTAWKKNTDGIAAAALRTSPALIAFAELSNRSVNKMLPRMDKALSEFGRAKGSDGRYWYRADGQIGIRDSWVFEPKSMLNGDDKQMSVIDFKPVGRDFLGLAGVFHAEHESTRDKKTGKSGDQIRVEQALECWDHLIAEAKKRGVPLENVFLLGDFNSESWVADALVEQRGVRVLASAPFVGWDGKSKKRFNYVFGKGSASGAKTVNTGHSDHQGIALTLHLVV